jgi:hypothetical protein
MLLRYAQNVAAGHGIVWNVGQHPVDGATGFLTMLLVATLHFAGVGLTAAIRVLDYLSIVALIVVVYATTRLVHGASRPVAMAASSVVAVGPTTLYMTLGFGTPFSALTAGVATASAYFCGSRPTKTTATVLSISCLVMGLTRPEGVLMAAFLAGALAVVSYRAFRRLLARQLFLWLL